MNIIFYGLSKYIIIVKLAITLNFNLFDIILNKCVLILKFLIENSIFVGFYIFTTGFSIKSMEFSIFFVIKAFLLNFKSSLIENSIFL